MRLVACQENVIREKTKEEEDNKALDWEQKKSELEWKGKK